MNVVITGASRGIGKSIAEQFAGDGQEHVILLGARDEQRLAGVAEELGERFPGSVIHFKACDLGRKDEAQSFGAWVLDTVSTIDVLINNAGTFVPGNISDEADGALEKMLEVNLYSAYHLTRSL
ncbi:MAG TPA: SDR family NAD(P)-dependent oxidoreductase, partial [Flavisolibacter sp.]